MNPINFEKFGCFNINCFDPNPDIDATIKWYRSGRDAVQDFMNATGWTGSRLSAEQYLEVHFTDPVYLECIGRAIEAIKEEIKSGAYELR